MCKTTIRCRVNTHYENQRRIEDSLLDKLVTATARRKQILMPARRKLTIINAGSAARRGNRASTGSEDAEPAPKPTLPMPRALRLARLLAAYSR